jgi:hypothetical protein
MFELLLLSAFSNLLNVFNQDFRYCTNNNNPFLNFSLFKQKSPLFLKRPYELRSFALECIELLLTNLSQQKSLDIKRNKPFMEFAWQQFCPSILCQFGDIGLPTKSFTSQTINFKQIYKILILLTGIIGGSKLMIPVFEAIYQRVLFYTPEDDRQLILKLFKNVMAMTLSL